jgi:hypothetical protein
MKLATTAILAEMRRLMNGLMGLSSIVPAVRSPGGGWRAGVAVSRGKMRQRV